MHNKPEVDLIFEIYVLNDMKVLKQNFPLSEPGDLVCNLKLFAGLFFSLTDYPLWFCKLQSQCLDSKTSHS